MIQGADKRVRPGQFGQDLGRILDPRDGTSLWARHFGKETGLDEESTNGLWLPVDDLLNEVLTDAALVDRQLGDEFGWPFGPLHAQGRQTKAGGPPLGPPDGVGEFRSGRDTLWAASRS